MLDLEAGIVGFTGRTINGTQNLHPKVPTSTVCGYALEGNTLVVVRLTYTHLQSRPSSFPQRL